MGTRTVVVGSRGSRLALAQTQIVVDLLKGLFPQAAFEVRRVTTEGDRVQDRPISRIGDKGIFIRAIESGLLEGTIDLAVHSLKDVPADVETPGLALVAFSAREDARDVLVSRDSADLNALERGTRVGTGSLRRRAQLRAARPDLSLLDIRGNVDTRLRKLRDGEYEAIVLAAAGLHRLGLAGQITQYLPLDSFTPDAGQGTIVVQARAGSAAAEMASAVDDGTSHLISLAEREVGRALDADCHSPVGAYAVVAAGRMLVRGMAADEGGMRLHRLTVEGPVAQAVELGRRVGEELALRLRKDSE